jgi:group I intron endonuclease
MNQRGIYAITNVLTGTVYYGQSVNMTSRLLRHARNLRHRKHDNPRLQRSWDKHGTEAFTFKPLWIMPFGDLTKWEVACIAGRRATGGRCYNMQDPLRVEPVCAETRAKLSLSKLGHQSGLGNKSMLGQKHTAETRAKISKAHIGQKHTAETRAKISKARIGKKRPPFSDEWRANISAAMLDWHRIKKSATQ